MLNRIIEVSEENRYVSLSRGFMVIKDESKILGQIPLDDISTLLLTSHGITLSKNVLNALAEKNCITVLCGKNYVPQSMVLPVANHCFFTKNVKMQIDCSVQKADLAEDSRSKNQKSVHCTEILRKRRRNS
jgi:CRISPR-associated protein Cas1